MNITPDKVSEIVRGSPKKNGVDAYFVKLNEDWGIKYFSDKETRDVVFERQELASQYGVGPAVGQKLDFQLGEYTEYGFITELVTVAIDVIAKELNLDNSYDGWYMDNYGAILKETKKLKDCPEYDDMITILEDTDIPKYIMCDSHAGNWGWNKQGNMVWIDFGSND